MRAKQFSNFSDIITFSRGSSGTYFDKDGVLQTAAPNEPRIDHDPLTGEVKGLLLEEQRTNLLTYSEDFSDSDWPKAAVSIQSGVIVAPDGNLTGDKIVEDASENIHRLDRVIGLSGETFTASVFLKKGERSFASVQLQNAGESAVVVDLSDGTITGKGDHIFNESVMHCGNNWFKVKASITIQFSGRFRVGPRLDASTGFYTGDGFSGIYIWGAQVESGSFATSYIPTEGSQVTRAADVAKVDGDTLDSIYNPDAGTLYVEGDFREGEQVVDLGTADLYEFSGSGGKLGITYESKNTTSELALKTAGVFEQLQYWPRRLAQGTLDTLLGYTQDQAPLLQAYSGAAAAYSLRSLNGSEFNPVVRVRRSLDNTEQDFTAEEVTDGTLVAFVGAGNDGFVTTWYDQSGNDNHATQTTAASQPKIVDAGALVTEGGKAALDFDGNDDYLELLGTSDTGSNPISINDDLFCSLVLTATDSRSAYIFNNYEGSGDYNGQRILFHQDPSGSGLTFEGSYDDDANISALKSNEQTVNFQHLFTNVRNKGGTNFIYVDGNESASGADTATGDVISNRNWVIGARAEDPSVEVWKGLLKEIILYPSDQSANRVGIETNINNHYGIY